MEAKTPRSNQGAILPQGLCIEGYPGRHDTLRQEGPSCQQSEGRKESEEMEQSVFFKGEDCGQRLWPLIENILFECCQKVMLIMKYSLESVILKIK